MTSGCGVDHDAMDTDSRVLFVEAADGAKRDKQTSELSAEDVSGCVTLPARMVSNDGSSDVCIVGVNESVSSSDNELEVVSCHWRSNSTDSAARWRCFTGEGVTRRATTDGDKGGFLLDLRRSGVDDVRGGTNSPTRRRTSRGGCLERRRTMVDLAMIKLANFVYKTGRRAQFPFPADRGSL